MLRKIDYCKTIETIQFHVEKYLKKYNIQSLVIGVSGGFDSGLNAALLKPICDKLGIPLIGRYIHIETNKQEERDRANAIGKMFCSDYKEIDLTKLYITSIPHFEETRNPNINLSYDEKIRRGNIKARLRMIHLYNLAQDRKGIVVDNDNLTEHLLGFWTIGGDIGDITPLADLFKTEAYELAKVYMSCLDISEEKEALQSVIDAVPTDGLGITSSDVEQFGVKSYNEVDEILYQIVFNKENAKEILKNKYDEETINKVLSRHINSNFKRNHPYRISIGNCIDDLSILK